MLLCKTCDAEVQPGQIFCVNCGARTEGNTYTADAAATAPPASDATVQLDRAAAPLGEATPPVVPIAPPLPPAAREPFASDRPNPAPLRTAPASTGPSYHPTESALPTSTLAVVSLVFGILGLLQLLPLISPLVAVITGHMARREIRAAGGHMQGDGMALTGLILGYVMLLLGVLICGFLALLIPFAALSAL
jgi:thiol:disulfide interchange protein